MLHGAEALTTSKVRMNKLEAVKTCFVENVENILDRKKSNEYSYLRWLAYKGIWCLPNGKETHSVFAYIIMTKNGIVNLGNLVTAGKVDGKGARGR